tara:strand:+ start:447 stop:668 length:222 start_codon:yes stop_codon:yes gene_type:complete
VEVGKSPILLAIATPVGKRHNKDSRVQTVRRQAFQPAMLGRTALVEAPELSHSCPETNNRVKIEVGEILLPET